MPHTPQKRAKTKRAKTKTKPAKNFSLDRKSTALPILANFPAGHGLQNAPLPIGAKVFLDAKKKVFL